MDGHTAELIQEEVVIHESEIHTTHTMSYIQDKCGQIPSHGENGHITNTMEACPVEDGGNELANIDNMLPTLEGSSIQTEHQQNNESATIVYENAKQNQYEIVHQVDNQHEQMMELDNIQDINEVEGQTQILEYGNQVVEVHQGQVIVQTLVSFESNPTEAIEEPVDDEQATVEAAALREFELEGGENGNLNSEEYPKSTVAVDPNQYDGEIQQETVDNYTSEDYVTNEEGVAEYLEQSNEDHEATELNQGYENLENASEIQLSSEQLEEDPADEQQQVAESNLIASSEETYQEYSSLGEPQQTNETEGINDDQAVTTTYKPQNIIDLAFASANQDDASSEIAMDQEDNQEIHNEVASSSVEQNVNIITNNSDEVIEPVESSTDQVEMVEKGEEETHSEVIEEIYYLEPVKEVGSGEEKEEEDLDEAVQSEIVDQREVDSETSKNSVVENVKISEKPRNVVPVQDIIYDWDDENLDEDNQVSQHKDQDTVEMQLNNLLNDNKKKAPVSSVKETQQSTSKKNEDDRPVPASREVQSPVETKNKSKTNTETVSSSSKKVTKNSTSGKESLSYIQPYVREGYSPSLDKDQESGSNSKRKMQSPRLGVKVPGRHLKSQIASPAEVTEVLKERLKEKQKDLDSPQGADIVFVKKLTQRFASKICPAGGPVPGLIPLTQKTQGSDNSTPSNESADNKELLAILEGDVDPDWSNLKSHSTVAESAAEDGEEEEEGNSNSSNTGKLNPSTERELALKQLMELPTVNKKGMKKLFKPTLSKTRGNNKTPLSARDSGKGAAKKEAKGKEAEKEDISKVEDTKKTRTPKQKKDSTSSTSTPRKPLKENDSQNTPSMVTTSAESRRIDETRSGRKRKPTEKALEQYATKKQKLGRPKFSKNVESPDSSPEKGSIETRRSSTDKSTSLLEDSTDFMPTDVITTPSAEETGNDEDEEIDTPSSQKNDKSLDDKKPSSPVKERISSPTPTIFATRRKLSASGRRIIPQRVLSIKKKLTSSPISQSKLSSPVLGKRPVGRPAKITVSKSDNVIVAGGKKLKKIEVAKPKGRRKGNREIDRLLQDEGVVNLLYDVGQPRKSRLVPITKSHKKVMDIEKAERDLNIRKKLVKNAVLGLRTPDVEADKMAQRSKRRSSPSVNSSVETEENSNRIKSPSVTSPTEFIYPAKIRNAADASIIVRRHSSSSFSSVSGSPRVSIDAPLEGGNVGTPSKADEETSHGLRSAAKRKHSSGVTLKIDVDVENNLPDTKRSKQQKAPQNSGSTSANSSNKSSNVDDKVVEAKVATKVPEDKAAMAKKQSKAVVVDKTINKKILRGSRSSSDAKEGEEEDQVSKVMTRSNGGGAGLNKIPPKNLRKKAAAGVEDKNTVSKESSVSGGDDEGNKNQDELSACLAEAATALSSVSSDKGPSRRSSSAGTTIAARKNKGPTISSAKSELSKSRSNSQNKEINIVRNGNLVQLILTPSSSNIVNGITLEVMQELREILTTLKTDQECRVVLLTSSGGTSFCEGLDLSTLLHTDKEKRKIHAEEMANAVKEFINCLATFNKPLVAGVQGAAVGLGVTILPLFDLVIASDKATFYTPYGKLGQIPEGAAIMTLSHVHGSAVASELLLGGRTLTASEALRAGLVTRVLWPDRFPLELVPSVKAMSEQSSQSMEATKALLRQSLRNKLSKALESETHILVKHWCSAECQEAIKAYIERNVE